MTVFRVCIKCDLVVTRVNNKRGAFGFYKNEYVRASDSRSAAKAAELKVREALLRNPSISEQDAQAAVLEIDEIDEGFSEAELSSDEGFVFFNAEAQ